MSPSESARVALDALFTARIVLLQSMPFFGQLATDLRLEACHDLPARTMATDGRTLFYDPDYVVSCPQWKLQMALVHELGHVILQHIERRQSRDRRVWAVAADLTVNALIARSAQKGFQPRLPAEWLYAPSLGNESTEEVYRTLRQEKSELIDWLYGHVFDPPSCCGTPTLGAPLTQEELGIRLARAACEARKRGRVPASVETCLNWLPEARVDWRAVLRRFLLDVAKFDYKWMPPNRRFLSQGLVLPRLRSEGGLVAVVVDTSGSMDDEMVAMCLSEVRACMEQHSGLQVMLIQCDAEVQSSRVINDAAELPRVPIQGRGGTSFIPALEHVESRIREGFMVRAVLYLTDLEGEFPETPPSVPVLWARTSDLKAPFGEMIDLSVDSA